MEVVPCQLRRPQGNFWTLENPWKNRWITTHETKTSLDLVACSQLCGRSRLQVYPSAMWRIPGCSRYGGLTPSSTWIGKIEKGWSTMINHHISGVSHFQPTPMSMAQWHGVPSIPPSIWWLWGPPWRAGNTAMSMRSLHRGHGTTKATLKANGSPPNSTYV